MDKAKPFDISKREVWEAFKRVKANRGAAGIDGQSIVQFEEDLSNNLYRIWNRLSSGRIPKIKTFRRGRLDTLSNTTPSSISFDDYGHEARDYNGLDVWETKRRRNRCPAS